MVGMTTYRYQVNFSKRFVTAILKGHLYHSYLRFVDWKSADVFRARAESGEVFVPCDGATGQYTMEDVTLSAIEPMMEAHS
jgi:hypothetical protein